MLRRKATAVWNGTGKEGKGLLSTPASGALRDLPYSFRTRFENEEGREGTNPEELIGAAHAGCFSMALAVQLANAGFTPDELRTTATLTMDKVDGKMTIVKSHLDVQGEVPGVDAAKFQELAAAAKEGCPVSRLLRAEISLEAKLV